MNKFLQFVCCFFAFLLLVLYKDSYAEARDSPFNSEKDSFLSEKQKLQDLEQSKVESKVAEFQPSPKKNVEKKILAANNSGGREGSNTKMNTKNTKDILAEEEQMRELIDHIDYAGATTHPPSEPPKKKKTNSNQKGLNPPTHSP